MERLVLGAFLALAACGSGGGEEESALQIDVSQEQEEQLCEILSSDVTTTPLAVDATPSIADADGIAATAGKKPVVLAEIDGGYGGYLKITLDPANQSPVILMFDEPMSFEPVLEDGSKVELVDAADGSELCDAAEGRYTWYVSGGTNYLSFSGAESAAFNLVFETVD